MRRLFILIIIIVLLEACGSNSKKESWEHLGSVQPTLIFENSSTHQWAEMHLSSYELWTKVIDGIPFYQLRDGERVYTVTKNTNYNIPGAKGENFKYTVNILSSSGYTDVYINLQ